VPPSPPTAPNSFGAALGETNQVTLTWGASRAYVDGPVAYRVLRNGTAISQNTDRTFVDQPAPGASYTYQVRAVDALGVVSPLSPAITVQVPTSTQVGDTTPPTTPTGLTAVSMTSRQIYLSWQPSTDDQPGAITYKLYRGTTVIAMTTDVYFIDTPRLAGTYTYTIKAFDTAGNKSAKSAPVKGYAFD